MARDRRPRGDDEPRIGRPTPRLRGIRPRRRGVAGPRTRPLTSDEPSKDRRRVAVGPVDRRAGGGRRRAIASRRPPRAAGSSRRGSSGFSITADGIVGGIEVEVRSSGGVADDDERRLTRIGGRWHSPYRASRFAGTACTCRPRCTRTGRAGGPTLAPPETYAARSALPARARATIGPRALPWRSSSR